MTTIFLTGASGFVGKNLIHHWNSKYEIKTLSLREEIDFDIYQKATALIHLAGKAHDLKNTSNPEEYFKVNYEKTKDLFELYLKSEVRDFIYFSSVKAVADTVEDILYEDVEGKPQTPYGASKFKAEQYLLNQELPEGKRLFILRPCMIHGSGNKGNLNLLYKLVKKGIPYPLGAFENKRSFLSIDNLIFILEKVITDPSIPGGIYNIADDQALSTTEVIKIIAEASNAKGSVWNTPEKLVNLLAKTGDLIHLPLNSERLKKLTESYVVSNDKIKKALKIKELPTDAKTGLMKTIKSFEI